MFTEITGNDDLLAEDVCGCSSRCLRNCIITCKDETISRAEILGMDSSMINGTLSS